MAIIIQQGATEYSLFKSVQLLNMFRVVITKNFCVLQIPSNSPSSTVGIQLHVSALYVSHIQFVI